MTATTTAAPTRTELLDALRAFICQRPGFDWHNYAGAPDAYRADRYTAMRDKADALALLDAVTWRTGIDAAAMLAELRGGRLTWDAERGELDYCTGQYFPTEYRGAAARALAAMLWAYFRDECGADTGDKIRRMARRELPGPLAARYFR